jgi:4-hydroxybenzoate polyprenyltransferase
VAVIYNNFIDRPTDLRNKRTDNPLAGGELSVFSAKVFFLINLSVFALIQFALPQPQSLLLGLLYLVLAFAYSNRRINVQSRGWWAPLLLAICYGVLPFMLGITQAASTWEWRLTFLIIIQIPLLYPILLAKDYKDLAGDRESNKLTALVRKGAATVKRTAITISITAACLIELLATSWSFSLALQLLPLLICYISFVTYIHNQKGRIPWLLQKLAMLSILATSLVLLQDLYG